MNKIPLFVRLIFVLGIFGAANGFAEIIGKDLYLVESPSDLVTDLKRSSAHFEEITTVKFQEPRTSINSSHISLLLDTFPNLTTLVLWGVNSLDLSDLTQRELNKFQEVDVFGGIFSQNNLVDLAKSKGLKRLSLAHNLGVQDDATLVPLKKACNLEVIYIDGNYSFHSFLTLADLQRLTDISINTSSKISREDVDDFYAAYTTHVNKDLKMEIKTEKQVYRKGF